jgi:hypothetical protein
MTGVVRSRGDRCRRPCDDGGRDGVLQLEARKVKGCQRNCRIQEEG